MSDFDRYMAYNVANLYQPNELGPLYRMNQRLMRQLRAGRGTGGYKRRAKKKHRKSLTYDNKKSYKKVDCKGLKNKKICNNFKKLKSDIHEISKKVESGMATLIHRIRNYAAVTVAANAGNHQAWALSDLTTIEDALGQLRYYDPTAPSTLVTADATTGSYQKEVLCTKQSMVVRIRANYQVPIRLAIYVCHIKNDTSILPSTAMSQGAADESNLTATSPLLYPSDIDKLKDLWSVKMYKKCILQPGMEISIPFVSNKSFQYDPSLHDEHNQQYQKRNNSMAIFVRAWGLLAHDTSADQQGFQDVKYDYDITRTYEFRYDGGADIKYVYGVDNVDTFTNGAQVCNNIASDIQVVTSA